ncbi:hypothetical protein J0X14_14280 [Muricauda sp. CAU 1633]|uniref:hypothetical protein n=1 Tax=Allomuricauda sp. CAU 1633 TaxID=2816036 RepID=UPI001A8CEA9C|nr:hypothetical protein [Muricauda sp. CAU 1633]MBO0323472.1 hypothetical protein [Muricauda sp. CAU 1633]
MSKFQNRIDGKIRINELEKVFIDAIEDFSDKNPDLTQYEVGAVLLKLLSDANNKELRN